MEIINKIKNKLIKLRVELKKESAAEKNNKNELLNSIKNLGGEKIERNSAWDRYRQRLQLYILRNDPRNFLRWEPIINSMFHNADKRELDYLINSDWDKWSQAITETWIGNPPRYAHYKKSSGNLIHTAYNLSLLFDHYKIDVKKINKIIEFGAGYGCMAKLINNLGFNGKYVIFDIPEFLALQKYYLRSTNTIGNFNFTNQIKKLEYPNPDIFIATWSLSESPIELRNEFLRKIGKPQYMLIAYQANFESIDNIKYFQEYKKNNQDYNWADCEISHLPKNYYLIGKKK
ncbi:MAG: putative sugar O-methyltransferase [Elusimicrobia bacterium]|nr:putative sugar O-methyltransferase [Elusimicrobiota bacterium]